MRSLATSAPGRICLFGEHQDFLGLPVIAGAINLRFFIRGTERDDRILHLRMPDIRKFDVIDLSGEIQYRKQRDYLRASINVLRRTGWSIKSGWNCTLSSQIPINAGVSSSSAMIVAWLRFLLEASGDGVRYSLEDLARLAHQAEVVEFGEPGGMMDHFASAIGGLVYIDCRSPFQASRLSARLEGCVLGDSLEKKETLGILADSKQCVLKGLQLILERYPDFDLHSTPLVEVEPLVQQLPEPIAKRLRANLINRDITKEALQILKAEEPNPKRLGELLTLHHEQLRDGIGVSTTKLDRLVEEALSAGALGAKMNGSGGGGCMFAYAPGSEEFVAEAIERAGGQAYIIAIDQGVRVEESAQ